jgi:hypothetical protein
MGSGRLDGTLDGGIFELGQLGGGCEHSGREQQKGGAEQHVSLGEEVVKKFRIPKPARPKRFSYSVLRGWSQGSCSPVIACSRKRRELQTREQRLDIDRKQNAKAFSFKKYAIWQLFVLSSALIRAEASCGPLLAVTGQRNFVIANKGSRPETRTLLGPRFRTCDQKQCKRVL